MYLIGPLGLIIAALVAMSSFIIAKKPESRQLFDKIAPFQGFLGAGLFAWGVYDVYYWCVQDVEMGHSALHYALKADRVAAIAMIGYIACELLIGFMLGIGLILAFVGANSGKAQERAVAVQQKLLGLALPIGLAGIAFAVLWLAKHNVPYSGD